MENKRAIIEEACDALLNDLKDDLTWKWDDRLDAFLSEFNTKKQAAIRTILEKHACSQWDNKTIKKAPGDLRNKAGFFSDLRAGQLLFTCDSKTDAFVVAAWWPWGDEKTVSLRIACPEPDEPECSGLFGRIKSFFTEK